MSALAESTTEAKREIPMIQLNVEHIAGGRARVSAFGGVLDHIDQIQRGSESQKLRFSQACDAKSNGSFDEVLSRLEREYTSDCYKVDPNTDDLTRILFTPAASF